MYILFKDDEVRHMDDNGVTVKDLIKLDEDGWAVVHVVNVTLPPKQWKSSPEEGELGEFYGINRHYVDKV